jgi:hypothetical protein
MRALRNTTAEKLRALRNSTAKKLRALRNTRGEGRAGQPPPIHAFGAVVCAYARQRQLEPALETVRRFYDLGGTPDAAMFDVLVDLAVRTGQFKRAMQVCARCPALGLAL